jgi:hypothetical protein
MAVTDIEHAMRMGLDMRMERAHRRDDVVGHGGGPSWGEVAS